jgi:hypothetical protein
MGASDGGPWVQMALFCQLVLEDTDGVLTPVRVVDRIVRSVVGPGPPTEMEPFEYELYLVVALKPGDARGRSVVTVELEDPSGETRPGPSVTALFESADRGFQWVVHLRLRIDREGLYWFNVRCDGRLLTRMPLRVVYQTTTLP